MHFKFFAMAIAAVVMLLAPAPANAACCDQHQHGSQPACCKDHHKAEQAPITVGFLTFDPQMTPAPPLRQQFDVWFHRPIFVGRSILQGRYVIEHDTDRMARGEPCTHIYAFNDRSKPIVAFACTHLERDRAATNVVVLQPNADGMPRLTEFQFAGETASHGHPGGR